MTGFESFLAFMVVMGILSIPLAAILTRRNSAIGQAWADRIRRKTEARLGPKRRHIAIPEARATASDPGESARQIELIEAQQQEIQDLALKIDFLQRLLEEKQSDSGAGQR